MLVPKDEWSEFHDRNEPRQEVDFGVGVSTVQDPRKGEKFGSLVNFRPESVLQPFLGVFERRGFLDKIHVREEAEDFGETVRLQNVEELERFLQRSVSIHNDMRATHHLEPETTVNHEEHQVDDFAQINHAVQVVSTFHKGDPPRLSRHYSDRPLRLTQIVLGKPLDKRFEQGRLPHSWRSDDSDNDRRWRQSSFIHALAFLARHLPLLWVSIDERHMKPFLVLVGSPSRRFVG